MELAACAINNIRKVQWITFHLQRRFIRTSPSSFISEKTLQQFKLKQARLQHDDGLPVYLKGGLRDRILYNATIALLIFLSIQVILDYKRRM